MAPFQMIVEDLALLTAEAVVMVTKGKLVPDRRVRTGPGCEIDRLRTRDA
jgi:hypothetical protein